MTTATDTIVTFVLDRSSSMMSCRDATIEAFNGYIATLKGAPISFSLIQFDTVGVETMYKNVPISDVADLTYASFQPRGGTPLIDAAYKAIKATERRLAELGTDNKVVICIQTDGEENSSREFTWEQLNDLIKEKTAAGWQFNFMGVGLDAYKQAMAMGIGAANTMAYNPASMASSRAAFAANASNTAAYARGASASTGYTMLQKQAAGDAIDPGVAITPPPAAPGASAWTTFKTKLKPQVVDDIDL